MFGLEFPIDPKLQAAIERRRINEEQRKARILDEKNRKIGGSDYYAISSKCFSVCGPSANYEIDIDALNKQIAERSRISYLEMNRQKEMEREMLLRDQMAVMADERERERRRRMDREIDRFRLLCQRPETRRDFDLNDREILKKSRPPREEEFDGNCGPASLQKFEGEDLQKLDRDRKQKEVQRVWLEQQRQERLALEKKKKDEEEMLDEMATRMTRVTREEMQHRDDHRRRLDAAIQDFNVQMTKHRMASERRAKQHEMERDVVDLQSHIFSDILAEDPSVARTSAFGRHRIVADRWKGMTADEVEQILRSRRDQIVEKRLNDCTRKKSEDAWDRRILGDAKADVIRERQRCRMTKEHERRLMEDNLRLANEQRSIQEHLNRQVYRGVTSDDFLSRFGTSCR